MGTEWEWGWNGNGTFGHSNLRTFDIRHSNIRTWGAPGYLGSKTNFLTGLVKGLTCTFYLHFFTRWSHFFTAHLFHSALFAMYSFAMHLFICSYFSYFMFFRTYSDFFYFFLKIALTKTQAPKRHPKNSKKIRQWQPSRTWLPRKTFERSQELGEVPSEPYSASTVRDMFLVYSSCCTYGKPSFLV